MNSRVSAAVSIAFVLGAVCGPATANGRFFPVHPSNARIVVASGVMTSFGIGNASGLLTIRDSKGSHDYYIGEKTLLKGKPIDCSSPPTADYVPKKDECPSWPSDIVLGTTVVRISYWTQTRPDINKIVRVAQRIDIPSSAEHQDDVSRRFSLVEIKAIGIDATSGNRTAFAKLLDAYAHSDGAVTEAVSDAIARATAMQPSLALTLLSRLSRSEQKSLTFDAAAMCQAGEADALGRARPTTREATLVQRHVVAFCASQKARSKSP